MKGITSVFQKCLFCYIAIMLSSCSFAPLYKRPPLPTAETYPREPCPQKCTNIRQLDWQDFFTDPTLQELIELALENNRDLRTAIARMEEARAIYGLKWADIFPTLNASAAGIRARVPGNVLPKVQALNNLLPTGRPFIASAYLAAFNINAWEIDFWGRLRNLKDVALENYLNTEEAECATFISLIGQVANTYLNELELNELVNIARKTVKSRRASYHLMKRRFEEGSSSKYDLVQSETLLHEAVADLTILQRKRELNWNAMTLLVGTQVCPSNNTLNQHKHYFIKEISPGLPSELLCNRPDVIAAEHRLKAANANIGAARAAFFPTISLTGAYGSASNQLKDLFRSGSNFWTYLPFITVPIFDWGRNMSDLGFAKARRNLAVTDYEHTIQVAFREVSDALTNRAWLAKQVVIQKRALAAQRERSRMAWIRYKYGTSPYLEVLDAERDKFSAEQALVQTQQAFLASGINLYTALGGGYCR